MSEFFEAFNPGARHWREQQQLDKTLVVDMHRGGAGPRPLDLDSGVVHLVMPRRDLQPPHQGIVVDADRRPDTDPEASGTGAA